MKICKSCAKLAGVQRIMNQEYLACGYCIVCKQPRGVRPFKGTIPERILNATGNDKPRECTAIVPERGAKPYSRTKTSPGKIRRWANISD